MILLDAYAVVAYLTAEPIVGERVRPLAVGAAVTTVNGAEVLDHLVRVRRVDPDQAVLDLVGLDLLSIVVDDAIGVKAALLRAKHYHRLRRCVSMADCIAAAAVLNEVHGVTALATSDPALLDMLHEEGGGVLPLPQSDGSTWTPTTVR